MNSASDRESQSQNLTLPQEDADFIALGMASAALLHRLHNTIGILTPQLRRLRKYIKSIDSGDRATLDAISDIADVMERQISSVNELMIAIDVLQRSTKLPAPLDVNSLLYEVWEELYTSQTLKTVRVSLNLPEDVPLVRADSHLLAEVFRSVFENALKAIDEETGHIGICSGYEHAGSVVQIEVKDNGTGIPQHILSRLFRSPIPSTESNKGLGLWLAHLILARFGGEISVKHTEVGHGTTIAITLPAVKITEIPNGSK
ncbi:MAG: HAMP domain-containing histidine kinase [Chloroflexi bacterium]|nr:HAMP domain-containing histidine kinase [Chloroflexota bacterium]